MLEILPPGGGKGTWSHYKLQSLCFTPVTTLFLHLNKSSSFIEMDTPKTF